MKWNRFLVLQIMVVTILISSCCKEPTQSTCDFINFKYYKNAQDYLGELSNEYLLIAVDTIFSNAEIRNFISKVNNFDQNYNYTIHTVGQQKFKEIPLKLSSSKSCEEITQIISELEQEAIIAYAHYTMQTDNCYDLIGEPVGNLCINSYGSSFHVKVFDENDLTDLNKIIAQTNTELVKQNEFMREWFELRATKNSSGDGLAMANFFYESGLFEHSEPGISKYSVE